MARPRATVSVGILVAVVVCVVGIVGFALVRGGNSPLGARLVSNDAVATTQYVIPPAAAQRMRDGERIDVLPATMQFRVGDTIRIRNDDTESAVVGPFYVDAKSTVTHRFTSAGSFAGECTVHPDGRLTITVSNDN